MTAEKTTSPAITRHQSGAGTFFRKESDNSFFGSHESSPFFDPAIQPKLTVSHPDDPQEKEADAVADHVMRMPEHAVSPLGSGEERNKISAKREPGIVISRQANEAEELQAKALPGNRNQVAKVDASPASVQGKDSSPSQSQPSFESSLNSTKGEGAPMSADTRGFMEDRFDADFGGVRVHTGSNAETLSRNINAQAFTHGSDIYFNVNKYAPHTEAGGTLLAHELTHTIQQGAGKNNSLQRKVAAPGHSKGFPYHLIATPRHANKGASIRPGAEGAGVPIAHPRKTEPDKGNKKVAEPKQGKGVQPTDHAAQNSENSGGSDGSAAVIKPALQSPKTPKKDPDFQQAKKSIVHEAVKQKKHHAPADAKRTEAENAAALPLDEQISQDAKEKNTAEIETVAEQQVRPENKFSAEGFKKSLTALINEKKPKTEDQAKEMAATPPVGDIAQSFSDGVATAQSGVTGPLEKKAVPDPEGGSAHKLIVGIPRPAAPPAPKPINAALVIPKTKTSEELSEQKESDRVDTAMADNKLTDDQLIESREPSFIETYKLKEAAKQKAAAAPAEYRKKEEGILESAEAKAGAVAAGQLAGLVTKNKKSGGDVLTSQGSTETKTEKRQREIKEAIEGIYQLTVIEVKFILQTMTDKVKNDFTKSLKEKTDIFNENLRTEISKYYGDWRIDDELFGPDPVKVNDDGSTRSLTGQEIHDILFEGRVIEVINPDVYNIFVSEKNVFTSAMDIELDNIAKNVELGLMSAHKAIQGGQAMITGFKATLKGDELAYANELEEEVKIKFESLETSIDDAKDDLLNTLADEYKDNLKAMDKSFKEINDELKKGWIERAIEFIETVAKTIYQLVDLVVSILSRLAKIIWEIVQHPIRFFETLVKGLMEGIEEFIENIGTYLQDGFWTWITGAVPGGKVKLTLGSGVEGMFKMVLNVLQLGPEDLQKVAEKVFGKEFMAMIDKVVETVNKGIDIGAKIIEPVIILFTQGPGALWQYVKEHVQEFIQSAFDRMKETVFFGFVEKGLKYIAGFFIPGGGFVKIVKAILSAFQFVADNMENIRQFFDAIFDSMEEALAGNTTGVKNKVIAGLKMGVVMALDFLAKLLGLDKIVDSIHKIIQTIRTAILNAVEFILTKLKPYVLAIVQKIKDLYQKGKDAAVRAGKKLLSVLGIRKEFDAVNGERHEMYFEGPSDESAELWIASRTPQKYSLFLANVNTVADPNKNVKKQEALQILGEIQQAKREALATGISEETARANKYDKINGRVVALSVPTARLFGQPGDAIHSLELSYSPVNSAGFATGMTVKKLTQHNRPPVGGPPRVSNDAYRKLDLRRNGDTTYYIKGHLLNGYLGGTGNDFRNLTPLSREGNSIHESSVEREVIKNVDAGKMVAYTVRALPGSTRQISDADLQVAGIPASKWSTIKTIVSAENHVPKGLDCEASILNDATGDPESTIVNTTVPNNIDKTLSNYQT